MTFKRSVWMMAALAMCAISGSRSSAQWMGQCGYISVGGSGGGDALYGYAAVYVYNPSCWGEGTTDNVAAAVQVNTPYGTPYSNSEGGDGSWSDGLVDVPAPLQNGECGVYTVQGWGAIGGWGYWFESYYDFQYFEAQCGGGGDDDGGGGNDDPPPDPPTITFTPDSSITQDYDTGDVIITAHVSPPQWEAEFYWVGDGQETGNPMERRFSTSQIGHFSATAVVYGQTEASAYVTVIPVLVLWPPEQTAPQDPTGYLPYSQAKLGPSSGGARAGRIPKPTRFVTSTETRWGRSSRTRG